MKRYSMIRPVSMIGLGIALGLGTAFAEIVQVKSKITAISVLSSYLKVDHLDQQTEKTEEIKIDVERGTHFEGVKSLKELKIGDEVSIKANYNNFTHEWKAQSIGPYSQQ